ncbi:efflux RND transporter periplasmic adaptor subunit [Carnobacterium sp. TMP28]|uniref:efflux RND transporter periplasmic adaptor subunit n=1 Tax=Carnobacterium sp. TMP28 TaxID=3397060 RepID=UPI0039E1AFEB
MKKKIGIALGIVAVIIIAVFVSQKVLSSKEVVVEEIEDPYGIDYFTVPSMEQVFVNGTVKPEQSQEFRKEEAYGAMGDLQVANGETVEKGQLFYTYENTEVATQLSDTTNQVARMETQRSNASYKRDLAIKNWNKLPEEERTQTLEEIKMDMSTDDLDAEITEMYNNMASLKEQRYKEIVAPFAGKVYIPEVKDAESPILKLISDQFYVAGTVNEKDVGKLASEQTADIKVISNDYAVTGKVSFIDLNPTEDGAQEGDYGQASTMSSYPVKLSLDTLEGIRNGYHVQAVVNIGKELIAIPTKAIHKEDKVSYVLVNDFGTVVRRIIQLGEQEGENTIVTSGLEAEDQIILSSKVPVEEGQLLNEATDLDAIDPMTMEE